MLKVVVIELPAQRILDDLVTIVAGGAGALLETLQQPLIELDLAVFTRAMGSSNTPACRSPTGDRPVGRT